MERKDILLWDIEWQRVVKNRIGGQFKIGGIM
jgi:hypothetical protein